MPFFFSLCLHAFKFVCAVFPCLSLSTTILTFICHPCCYHLLPSLPPSIHQQPMLSKTVRLIFFLSFILKHHIHLSAERGHYSYRKSSFSIPLCLSVHPLLPGETVIMAVGDSGQTAWLPPTSLTAWVAALSPGFTCVLCVFPACVFCFVTICEHSVTHYHRAIWDAEECLHQPVSACLRERLSAMMVVLLLLFWCRFRAHSIIEFSHYSTG